MAGGGNKPCFQRNKVIFYDYQKKKAIKDLLLDGNITNIKFFSEG